MPRSAARLLFDFGVMVAWLKTAPSEGLALDCGAGTGWIPEWLVRLGHRVVRNPVTIAFVPEQKAHDPTWIERDLIPEQIDGVARGAGLRRLTMVPVPRTDSLVKFSLADWQSSRRGWSRHRTAFAKRLARVNHHDRVTLHCDKV